MPYEAILFDFDGVLMDTEPVHFDCWREVLLPHGVDLDWETYHGHCIGVADYTMLEFLGGRAVPPVPAGQLWKEYALKNRRLLDRVVAAPPLPAATQKLLAVELRDYKLAVVSSSGRAEVEPILVASGIREHFQALVFGGDVA
ncbi:MAG: HAD family phosphatase, partial [bacterium]|nr:HAD family phosphatase [bacterium]